MMKTYSAPITEICELILGTVLCGSPNAGTEQQTNPVIQPGVDPNAARRKVF